MQEAPAELQRSDLNALNEEILLQLQESGIAVPSATMLDGRFALRCANVNHRSKRADFRTLVEAVVRIGREVAGLGMRRNPGLEEAPQQVEDQAQHH